VPRRRGAHGAHRGGDQPRRASRDPAELPAGGDRQPVELAREHGAELSEQTFAYIATALAPELRGFDRIGRPSDGELLLLLPGADGPRGEMVARRVLDRLRTIKVEAEGIRRALRFSVGLAAWRRDVSGEDLMAQARAATRREQAEDAAPELATPATLDISSPPAFGRHRPS